MFKPSIVDKYASKTRMGMIPNMKKTNQDSHVAVKDLAGIKGLWFFGVMDGHGINGHLVSDFVKKYLPNVLASLIEGGTGYEAFNIKKTIESGKKGLKKSVPAGSRNNPNYLPPLLSGVGGGSNTNSLKQRFSFNPSNQQQPGSGDDYYQQSGVT